MKLVRYGEAGAEKPGIVDADQAIRSLEGIVSDILPETVTREGLAVLAAVDVASLPKVDPGVRLGCPIRGVGKIVAIGLNYRRHAEEAAAPIPEEPIVFLKVPSSIAGPDDDLAIPTGSLETDWEIELAVVIGAKAKRVAKADVPAVVAGYMVANDVSERHYQHKMGGTWDKGKNFDGFSPLGPWLVTPDEVPDPQALGVWLDVNGVRMQQSSTADMIFDIKTIISYVSGFITLYPGDVVITGTPEGVGLGQKPPRFLRPGDVVTLGIDGLGVQRQLCVAE